MNIFKKLRIVSTTATLLVIFMVACRQMDTPLKPPSSIEGTYQATLYRTDANGYTTPSAAITTVALPYPINGHSLTMTIKSVTEDSVRVVIQPDTPVDTFVARGVFSPTQVLSFSKAYIKSDVMDGGQKRYFIYLTPDQPTSELNDGISIYGDGKQADYFFNLALTTPPSSPPLPKARIAIKFEKLN